MATSSTTESSSATGNNRGRREDNAKDSEASSSSSSSSLSSSSAPSYWSRWWNNNKNNNNKTTPQDSLASSTTPPSSLQQQQQQPKRNDNNTTTNNNDSSSSPPLSLPPSQHSMFSKAYWDDLMDDQRLERLQQCERLTYVLRACQAKHQKYAAANKNNDNKLLQQHNNNVPQLDQLSEGLRMLKYFDWRHRIAVHQPGCVPERHAVWACRSVALGCGSQLQQLKQCFQQEGHTAILQEIQVGYELGDNGTTSSKPKIPCREFQQAVGQCVSQNAQRLQTKQQERRELQQQPKPQPHSTN